MKAVYAGSFDPFTIGHHHILMEATGLFEEVHIILASNTEKARRVDCSLMLDTLQELYANNPQVKVLTFGGLVADYCNDNNVTYLIRGLRNSSDYLYEENIAKINQEINPSLRTLYLRAQNDTISSSMVWELYTHGKQVDKYLPYPAAMIHL